MTLYTGGIYNIKGSRSKQRPSHGRDLYQFIVNDPYVVILFILGTLDKFYNLIVSKFYLGFTRNKTLRCITKKTKYLQGGESKGLTEKRENLTK